MKGLQQVVLLLAISLGSGLVFAETGDVQPEPSEKKKLHVKDIFTTEKPEGKRKSRLRFKSDGPTCMCDGGLTEKDLSKQRKEQ